MKSRLSAATILLLAVTPALAHRLDEYLQGTIFLVEKNRVQAQITLTPGVAVFPVVLAEIDTDADGVISAAEQRAYAGRVLRDLSLTIDGHVLAPQLLSVEFPAIKEMKGGLGEIRIEFDAALPRGGPNQRLVFENHHLSRIAAYQVNCLVPRDPDIRILGQNRNYSQSVYELDFSQPGVRADLLSLAWLPDTPKLLGIIGLLLVAVLASGRISSTPLRPLCAVRGPDRSLPRKFYRRSSTNQYPRKKLATSAAWDGSDRPS